MNCKRIRNDSNLHNKRDILVASLGQLIPKEFCKKVEDTVYIHPRYTIKPDLHKPIKHIVISENKHYSQGLKTKRKC